MIAIREPFDADRLRKSIPCNFFGRAEGIALSLKNQCRGCDRLKMFDPKALRIPGRMKWVPEADQPGRPDFVGDHAGHASPERFAADEGTCDSGLADRIAPGLKEHRLPIGRS